MRLDRFGPLAGCALALCAAPVAAQSTVRESLGAGGVQGNGNCSAIALSADGFTLAFASEASNLVAVDTNAASDVFVRDLQTGVLTRASVDSNGVQGDGPSGLPALSGDGRYLLFESNADNLVLFDTNGVGDMFVRDRVLGTTTRASVDSNGVEGNGQCYGGSITADGRFVAFWSTASNLVPGDTNGTADVFVRDMLLGTTICVSVDSNGTPGDYQSAYASISADGRYVAFQSAADILVPADGNGAKDVFVRDLFLGTTTRVSVDSNGVQGDSDSQLGSSPALSADGGTVVFWSFATNLVAGDTNGLADVFVHDFVTGSTQRVSLGPLGAQSNGQSSSPSISADGLFVAFTSQATNLVPSDSNFAADAFLRGRLGGVTERISAPDAGGEADGYSYDPIVSAAGASVLFFSQATNLVPGDTNQKLDVFLRVRAAPPDFTPVCFGDGIALPCPCANSGTSGRGCENSAATGGAQLGASGTPSLSSDSVQLSSAGELPSALSILLQGAQPILPVNFGDGLRCTAGGLRRLYVHNAIGGAVEFPQGSDLSISARSAALGAPIQAGSLRIYQVYYRDPSASFCPIPEGNTYNISSGIEILWGS